MFILHPTTSILYNDLEEQEKREKSRRQLEAPKVGLLVMFDHFDEMTSRNHEQLFYSQII